MANIKNFVDEKTSGKIIDALCALDFDSIHKLAKNSGIPVDRLQDFVDGDEKITQLDKGKLITHLIASAETAEEKHQHSETNKEMELARLKDFQRRKAG